MIVCVLPAPPQPKGGVPSWYYFVTKRLEKIENSYVIFPLTSKQNFVPPELKVNTIMIPIKTDIKNIIKRKIKTVFFPYSYLVTDELVRKVKKLCERSKTLLHVENIWTGNIIFYIQAKSIIFLHHILNLDYACDNSRSFETLRQKFQERRIISKFNFIRVESEKMEKWMREEAKKENIFKIPCAISLEFYRFKIQRGKTGKVGLIAGMGWHLGLKSALYLINEIAPLLKYKKIVIGGWNAGILRRYVKTENVEIIENLKSSEDFFRSIDALCYPLMCGSGMKMKVLESMAYGVPVISTYDGFEGIKIKDGENCLVAKTPAEFVEKIEKVEKLKKEISLSGRETVEKICYDAETKLLNTWENLSKI